MPQPVLFVEDDEDDVILVQRAWNQGSVSHPLLLVHEGQQALDYLGGAGAYADRARYPMPCLVLLDWKLPLLTGHEVLKSIRAQPALQTLPVLVLSSWMQSTDIDCAYRLGANAYLEKPLDEERLVRLVTLIRDFWLRAVRFPPTASELRE